MADATVTTSKVAYVTGTNSGVGLSVTVALAKAGFYVFATMRSIEKATDLLEAAAAAGEGVKDRITVDQCDVADDDSVAKSAARLLEAHGRCDVVVNNAGYSVFGSVEMLPMERMKAQFETNFFGVIRVQKAFLPTLRKQRSGKIINITSVGGVWGQPFNDVYCASKFAVEGLAESQAPLFREFGVYQTNVEPGAITTKFTQNAKRPDMATMPPEYGAPLQSTIAAYMKPGNSAVTPDQVADVIMEQVINVEHPPLRVQTNPTIQGIFEMQSTDPTGETGVNAAKARFFAPQAKADEEGK